MWLQSIGRLKLRLIDQVEKIGYAPIFVALIQQQRFPSLVLLVSMYIYLVAANAMIVCLLLWVTFFALYVDDDLHCELRVQTRHYITCDTQRMSSFCISSFESKQYQFQSWCEIGGAGWTSDFPGRGLQSLIHNFVVLELRCTLRTKQFHRTARCRWFTISWERRTSTRKHAVAYYLSVIMSLLVAIVTHIFVDNSFNVENVYR